MPSENASQHGGYHAPIIGYHRAPLTQKFGAPRQPNLVALTSTIEMLAPYDDPAAFIGMETFSHIWISWHFHHNYIDKNNNLNQTDSSFRPQVRPPRLGGNQKVGVFASRSMYRPSALGLSVVKLERIDVVEGRVLLVISGADMIDATPITDIKPYVAYSDAIMHAVSGFAPSAPIVLEVTMTDSAHEQFMGLVNKENLADNVTEVKLDTVAAHIYQIQNQLLITDMDVIKALIAQDPRPAYRRDDTKKVFVMRYKSVDVSFGLMESKHLQITDVVEVSV
ncbi:tRNA (N6-threonylcarbamoyladenosine(37)-N6)-methyltransferase TrmO [Psychrobacter alimentarius]|uniref:tRNA (N6-threonylcarbamoyladenosine(37)-N6)-methyltransferase TrmO n=1 Tax=Psychrobacter alimentarius TaxID=261164 RepID=UPI00191923AC|nr:tRNA (N6-threonylcarbamoyladenosine(37)-N6)-methyltransferase TrmO [Psychrobacter alimentarius]